MRARADKTVKWGVEAMAKHLEETHSLSTAKAQEIAARFPKKIMEVLLAGKTVVIRGVVTIRAVKVPAKESHVFGVWQNVPEHIGIRTTTSKAIAKSRERKRRKQLLG